MDYRGVKQNTYKKIKKEITKETALNVGYYPKVINEINNETLLEIIKNIALNGWIKENTKLQEIENMLVTESVKNMNFQEFKEIADNFFSFVPDDEEKYYKASKLEITRENYEYLIKHTNKAFGLENKLEEIEKERNSLDNKINILENKTIKNEDEVIGIDLEKEELLLLKSPINSYIDEEVVIAEEIINDYRLGKDDYTQILDYLTKNFEEIKIIHNEYILNNDKYRGLLDINYYDIDEINYEEIPLHSFSTHKEYYNYAKQFNSFNKKYTDYKDYITKRYNYIYQYESEENYAEEIIKNKREEIDKILEQNELKLITKDINYTQGKTCTLGYLADKNDNLEIIESYLENYLGAWYKGRLTELQIIPFSAFEKGKYLEEIYSVYYINYDLIDYKDNKLKEIQKMYPELEKFKTKEWAKEYLEQQENKNIKQEKRGKSI